MQQEAMIARGIFDIKWSYVPKKKKNIFLLVIKGKANVSGVKIEDGDSIETDEEIKIIPEKEIDFVLIEV